MGLEPWLTKWCESAKDVTLVEGTMFDFIASYFSADLAIDLGSSNTLVFLKGKGIVINEPTVVAIGNEPDNKNQLLAVGREARDMLGRTPSSIRAIRPIESGVIVDIDRVTEMLKSFLHKSHNRTSFVSPRVIVCIPVGITEVERRALFEAVRSAGAREVHPIEEPMAAAIGAGMPITEPSGTMIVDIGGGTCEVAVISLGGIVFNRSIRIGGQRMDKAIANHIKKRYSLLIGERSAENVRMTIGNAWPGEQVRSMEVKGRDLLGGVPRTVEVDSEEIRHALEEPLQVIVEAVRHSLEKIEPELASDIVDRGIMLSGGGSLLHNLDRRIANETGLKVSYVPEPLQGTVLGAGQALENIDLLEQVSTELD